MTSELPELLVFMRQLVTIATLDRQGRLRLPPERELAARFSMQRSSMREYLATLSHLGFIQRTQGRGTFLQMPSADFLQLYFDLALQLNYISVDSLQTAREMLEREIVQSAARNASADDIATLSRYRDRIMRLDNVTDSLAADYAFHQHLAWMTGNPIIIMLMQGLASVLREVLYHRRALVRTLPEAVSRTNATHHAIVEALAARDPDRARQAMQKHFQVWNEQALAAQSRVSRPPPTS